MKGDKHYEYMNRKQRPYFIQNSYIESANVNAFNYIFAYSNGGRSELEVADEYYKLMCDAACEAKTEDAKMIFSVSADTVLNIIDHLILTNDGDIKELRR